jgi:pimeloyl-ACP methyl ester carboxylesterase
MTTPYQVRATDAQIADLRRRLADTRWPDQLPGAGWSYGTELGFLQRICRYWERDYDWHGFHARLNAAPQFLTEVDGVQLHYYDVPAERPDAPVLLLLHGWPGSVAELLDLIEPLSRPADPADGLHLIVPSLPGYGFSGPTTRQGVDARAVADVLDALMARLGHDRYLVHGGDWGSFLAVQLAGRHPERIRGIHTTLLPMTAPPKQVRDEGVTDADRARRAALQAFWVQENGYQSIQGTKPQTLAYGLTDSPAGLAGWVLEKFHGWTDGDGDPDDSVPRDRLLDNLSVYWLTGTIGSSMRLYYESNGPGRATPPPAVRVPTGHASFPAEIGAVPRSWAERAFPLVHWSDMPRGGHFAALEAPDLLVADLQAFARTVRSG